MTKRMLVGLLTTLFLTGVSHADAQQAKIYRVGVIMQGGPYYEAIDGLRDGLRKLGGQPGSRRYTIASRVRTPIS